MLDLIQNAIQNWAGNIPNGGGSVFTSTSSNGFGLDVIVKDLYGKVQAIYPNQNQIDAQNIINQLLGR